MKKSQSIKAYYFFDEAGDTQILARKGVNLIEKGMASKTFMVGYLETTDQKGFSKSIRDARKIKRGRIPCLNTFNEQHKQIIPCKQRLR